MSAVNSTSLDARASITGDGLALYFDSLRSGTSRIYFRDANVGARPIRSACGDRGTGDAGRARAALHPPRPHRDLLLCRGRARNGQIFRSPRSGGVFGSPAAMSTVNSSFNEQNPVITPDELRIYFASTRTDGGARGGWDIWMAERTSTASPFGPPINVQELNSFEDEKPSWVSADSCRLYFGRGQGMYVAEHPR